MGAGVVPMSDLADACHHCFCAALSPDGLEGRQLAPEAKAGTGRPLHPLRCMQKRRGRSYAIAKSYDSTANQRDQSKRPGQTGGIELSANRVACATTSGTLTLLGGEIT